MSATGGSACGGIDRQNQRPGKMFVTAVAKDPDFLESCTDGVAISPLFFRQAHSYCTIGKADLECVDGFFIEYTTAFKVFLRRRCLVQAFVIIIHNLVIKLVIIGIGIEWIIKAAGSGSFDMAARLGTERRLAALVKKLESMAKADTVELLNKLDRVAGSTATHAVIQALGRCHDKGCFFLLVKRAVPCKVSIAVFVQFYPAASYQRR